MKVAVPLFLAFLMLVPAVFGITDVRTLGPEALAALGGAILGGFAGFRIGRSIVVRDAA